jgi:hypothetical protein
LLGGFVDLVEGLDGVEDGLHLAGLEVLVEDGVEVEVFYFAAAVEDSSAFAVGGDEAAAVDLDLAVLADEAELDGEPEETAHALEGFGAGEAGADFAVGFEEVGKDGMGVHGDVAEDVVKDVGLRGVLHGFPGAEPGGGGEHAGGEHLEEGGGGEEAADGGGLPAGAGLKESADGGEVGELVFAEADLMEAVEIFAAGVGAELGHAPGDEFGPDGVLLGGVVGPCLLDEEGSGDVEFLLGEGERGGCDGHGVLTRGDAGR